MNEKIEHIICRYLSGESTPDEEKTLFEWINLSKENERLFFDLTLVWRMKSEIKNNSAKALNHSLGRLNAGIDRYEKKTRKRSLARIIAWGSVAAAIIGLTYIFTHIPGEEFTPPLITYSNTMPDSIMTITLDDHTIVWLNTNSSLAVSPGFPGNERRVNLSGCAFFEVTKDSLHPFVVSSDRFQVRVLGTSFGVRTDYSENESETILLEGAVQIENTKGEKLAVLSPGQQALLAADMEKIDINTIDVRKRALWRFGIISLQNVSIAEIISHLEEVYQVKIRIDDIDMFEENRYNFSFLKNKNPEDALRYLYFLTGRKGQIVL